MSDQFVQEEMQGIIVATPTGFNVDENQMVELEDGRLMLLARAGSGQSDLHYRVAYSDDEGETWSAAVGHPDLPTCECQGSLIRYTSSSDYEKSRLLFAGPASLDRSHMTVYIWPVRKKMSHSLTEEFCDTASEEDASHELGTFRHGLQFSSRKLFQLAFVLCLMARQLVVLEIVPYFLVRIPIWRIRR